MHSSNAKELVLTYDRQKAIEGEKNNNSSGGIEIFFLKSTITTFNDIILINYIPASYFHHKQNFKCLKTKTGFIVW